MQLLMEHNVFSRDMNNKMLGVEIANDNLLTVKRSTDSMHSCAGVRLQCFETTQL